MRLSVGVSSGLGQLVVLEVAPDDLRGGHVAPTTPHVELLPAILSDTVILSSPATTEREVTVITCAKCGCLIDCGFCGFGCQFDDDHDKPGRSIKSTYRRVDTLLARETV